MSIASNIKRLRESHGMSQLEFGNIAGVTDKAVSTWETGKKEPRMGAIQKIADHFGLKKSDIIEDSDSTSFKIPSNATPATDVPMIPEVGEIAAGVPILADQNIIGYLPAEGIKNPEEYFYLRVNGDSMINAGIPDGSSVLIHKQSCAEDGQIVACMVNGDSATLKRFKQLGGTVLLIPENSKYKPIIVKSADFETGYARICGIAVRCLTIKEL